MFVTRDPELESHARQHDRHRAQGDRDPEPGRGITPASIPQSPANAPNHLEQIEAEVGQNSDDAAQLDHGGEGHAGVPPTQQQRHHLQMGRAADRQKLREPLHHAQHQGMPAGDTEGRGLSDGKKRHRAGGSAPNPMAAWGHGPPLAPLNVGPTVYLSL